MGTAAIAAQAVITAGTDKRIRTGMAAVIAGICIPVILAVMCILNIAAAGAEHNRAAVKLAFHGGYVPPGMPVDYREYIYQMQESFLELDTVLEEIGTMMEGEAVDDYLVKAVFYSLYFGEDRVRLAKEDYERFRDCFVEYEERIRETVNEDGSITTETYTVAVAIKEKTRIFEKVRSEYGKAATADQQANAVNVWYVAKYGRTAPAEGDSFRDWREWNGEENRTYYELPESAAGMAAVELALTRLGHPYSMDYRGVGDYVDCSYLTMWCYERLGIRIPPTASEQGRYLAENHLTIAKEELQPGDLVFWSYKPNGKFMNITHVGIYAGDGKVIDASSTKGMVVCRNLYDSDKQVLYGRPG